MKKCPIHPKYKCLKKPTSKKEGCICMELYKEKCDKAYEEGNPIISDLEYDSIFSQNASAIDTPQKSSGWEKAKLSMHMGSLLKVNDLDDLKKWAEKYTSGNLHISEKLDGLSVELTYVQGKLTKAITRGTGKVGDNITDNIMKIPDIPHKIDTQKTFYVRGEVVLDKYNYQKNFSDTKNPRNTAAGCLRRLDGKGCEYLSFYALDTTIEYPTKEIQTEALKRLFYTPKYRVGNLDVIEDFIEVSNTLREDIPYEIDGMVIQENILDKFHKSGFVDNRPRAARAFKFKAEKTTTILKDVIIQTGKTGVVTPVAIVEPVDLMGVTVSRASLCNFDLIKKLNLSIGCKVEIQRANDVTPQITKMIEPGNELITTPHKCPSCGHKLKTCRKNVTIYTCPNVETCPAQVVSRMDYFLKTFGVKGIGPKILEALVEKEIINDIVDLFSLTPEEMSQIDKMSVEHANKLLKEFKEKTEETDLNTFLTAICIPGIGSETIKLIEEGFKINDLSEMFNIPFFDLVKIKGIGSEKANAFLSGLVLRNDLIEELEEYIKIKEKMESSNKFSDLVYCMTGVRDKELSKILTTNGAKEVKSITNECNTLVCADINGNSSKLKKAREKDIRILTLEDFRKECEVGLNG